MFENKDPRPWVISREAPVWAFFRIVGFMPQRNSTLRHRSIDGGRLMKRQKIRQEPGASVIVRAVAARVSTAPERHHESDVIENDAIDDYTHLRLR